MALTISNQFTTAISFEEYLELVSSNVDPHDEDSIIESAPYLAKLGANRTFLLEKINSVLINNMKADWRFVSMQTFFLAEPIPGLRVRANIWTPIRSTGVAAIIEAKRLSYGVAHDHNFPLLTIGYHGEGYFTDIHEYDRSKIIGLPGESVELKSLGREQLTLGKIMYFRPCIDVHTQIPPTSTSISLNLMGFNKTTRLQQYYFDTTNKKIIDNVESEVSINFNFLQMAAEVGDESTTDLLLSISKSNQSERVRAGALVAASKGKWALDKERILSIASQDSNNYVYEYAKYALLN